MKKKMLVVALIAISLALCAAGTYAYFSVETPSYNVITTNGVSIALNELQASADGAELRPWQPDEAVSVMPGTQVSKIVTVQALDAACWVRVRALPVFTDASEADMQLSEAAMAELIALQGISSKWQYNAADGWYYYAEPIADGAETEPFMETVAFSANIGNEYQGCTLTLTVEAEAVQSANNGTTGQTAVWA